MPTIDRKDYFTKKAPKRTTELRALRIKVYASSQWRKLRVQYLMAHPLCELCEEEGLTVLAEDVHHKDSFTNHPDNWRAYAYSYENLQSVCKKHHGIIHSKDGQEEDY